MSATKETVESKIKKIVENCIHKDVLKDKEAYEQYNGVVGTTYDANSYEDDITNTPDYLMDHIPGGIMVNVHDYSKDYLTTEVLESGTISFMINASMNTDMIKSISYSTDNGTTWNKINNNDDKEDNLYIYVEVNEGDNVLWKGDAITFANYDNDWASGFENDIEINVSGNIMSLLYGDNFSDKTSFPSDITSFYSLFCDDVKGLCNIVNAKNLILPAITLTPYCYTDMFSDCTALVTAPELPATTLAEGCYEYMFNSCTSLVTPPELPATILAEDCYEGMFQRCTALVTAPKLPATTLAKHCYGNMFYNCTSLVNAPELPATTLVEGCYANMFSDCTSLTTAPELPATTLAKYCYYYMFNNCTSLVNAPQLPATILANYCYEYMFYCCTSLVIAPELPATTLTEGCYQRMFYGCRSLTTAPELPGTTLSYGCYQGMFQGCTSLVTSPALPATTLAEDCYGGMFAGCTSLNHIEMLATDISATNCLSYWVDGVASTGTFVKAQGVNIPRGASGIPSGWTVEEK